MEIIYRADDGAEFKSYKECHQHETNNAILFQAMRHEMLVYDGRGNLLDLGNCIPEDLEYEFEQISYITFETQNAIDLFTNKAKDFGQPYFENGINRQLVVGERYYYDEDKDVWCCLEDKYKELDKISDVFVDK